MGERAAEAAEARKVRKAQDEIAKLQTNVESSTKALVACVAVGVAVLLVWAVQSRASRQKPAESLAEPLMKPEEKPTMQPAETQTEPLTRPFEGTWLDKDGRTVSIKGSTVQHSGGKEEQLTDLEEGKVLYTHRMSVRKSWFGLSQAPAVKGATAKVDADGALRWDDGRVWTRGHASSEVGVPC